MRNIQNELAFPGANTNSIPVPAASDSLSDSPCALWAGVSASSTEKAAPGKNAAGASGGMDGVGVAGGRGVGVAVGVAVGSGVAVGVAVAVGGDVGTLVGLTRGTG